MVSGGKRSGAGERPHLGYDRDKEATAWSRGDRLLPHFKAVSGSSLQWVSIQGEGQRGTRGPHRCFLAWWWSSSGVGAAWRWWQVGKQSATGFGALKGGRQGFFYRGRVRRVEGRLIHWIYLVVDPQIVDFRFGFAKGRIWFRLGLKTNSQLESDSTTSSTRPTAQGCTVVRCRPRVREADYVRQ
jgi:hypothetical protein